MAAPEFPPELPTAARDLITSMRGYNGGEAGDVRGIRKIVYDVIQSQTVSQENGAIYNELKCPIHFGLLGAAQYPVATQNEPITLTCGHTFCRGCVSPPYPNPQLTHCPNCREPIRYPIAQLRVNTSIKSILERLTPMAAAPAAGAVGPAIGGSRKRKSRRSRK
jgi:hypothetical protein